jgi:hypothetical protein
MLVILTSLPPMGPAGADGGADDPDVTLLAFSGVPTQTAGLLAYVNGRCGKDADLRRVGDLIRQLGDADFETREQASERLVALGFPALPQLGPARRHRDPEVASQARGCVAKIEARSNPAVLSAAVRALARQPSADVARALLRYLPYACDQELEEDSWFNLDALPLRQGPIAAVLAEALRDQVAVRRAAAGYVLGRRGDRGQRAAAQKLLRDSDPAVRLRVAQGLLGAGQKAALPALVPLLEEGGIEVAWQAEELLRWAAGKESPEVVVGAGSPGGRKRCRQAWEAWWAKRGETLEVAGLSRRPVRPVLCLVYEAESVRHELVGRVWLCGGDGRPRWELGGLPSLAHVAILAGGRVLLSEFPKGGRSRANGAVTERDLDGTVRWRYETDPTSAERLANGNTFIANSLVFMEVTPEGKEVYLRNFAGKNGLFGIGNPQRLRSGHLLFQAELAPNRLTLIEVDHAAARARRKVEVAESLPARYVVRPLPNGHYLVMSQQYGRMPEVNGEGKVVWQPRVTAADALRLRDGNTLIAGFDRVAEIDPAGKTVWEARARAERLGACFGLLRLGFENSIAGPRPGPPR